jgi:hypothetical protein
MKEEWILRGAIVPVNVETTAALVAEIKRLIDVVGDMALAQPEQEPDVVMHPAFGTWTINNPPPKNSDDVNLYYAPPQRTWVGLTDEEEQFFVYDQVKQIVDSKPFWVRFADAIEAKLKEKNHEHRG